MPANTRAIPAKAVLAALFLVPGLTLAFPPSTTHWRQQPFEGGAVQGIWMVVAAMLVFLMQIGFVTFESASVQARHAQGIAVKNLINLATAGLGYTFIGYAIMYGPSWHGLIGVGRFPFSAPGSQVPEVFHYTFMFYNAGFAAVVATIVSSAMVERTRFEATFVVSFFVGAWLYPTFGHWVWNPGLVGPAHGILAPQFHDFAGGTVIHCVGGAAALAGAIAVGPRSTPPAEGFRGNLPLATLGALFLWVGWIGFNGGSARELSQTPGVITNTNVAAMAAMGWCLFWFWLRPDPHHQRFRGADVLVAMMGGLVAVTADSDRMSAWVSALVGGVGGHVAVHSARLLRASAFRQEAPPPVAARLSPGDLMAWAFGAAIGVESLYMATRSASQWPAATGGWWAIVQDVGIAPSVVGSLVAGVAAVQVHRAVWRWLLRQRVDDPVDAIAVHGVAGLVGTLMAGVVKDNGPGCPTTYIAIQLAGLGVAIVWSFGLTWAVVAALRQLDTLRVAPSVEEEGVGADWSGTTALPLWSDYVALQEVEAKARLLDGEVARVKGSLVHHMRNVAHQIISPLRGVTGVLQKGSPEADYLEVAMFRANNMMLLDATARTDPPMQFDVLTLIQEIVQVLGFLASHKQRSLRLEAEPGPVTVSGTPNLIKQAVMNLVDNAIHYGTSDVTISVDRSPDHVRIHVYNLGPRIGEEARERLFERGYRGAAASKARADGTGYGLAIVAEIARDSGGRAWLEPVIAPETGGADEPYEFVIELPNRPLPPPESP